MATLGAVFSLSLALTILNTGKGLEIVPSTKASFESFYESGTNLTISCSEEGLVYLDWHKDTSDLSSCSANAQPYCLPGGRYTYENGSFNIFLKTMKSDDCGRYTCKTHKGSKSFDLQLIDRVNRMDVVENSDSINMTTDCVYPTYTVNVQWFYIPEGGSPVLYNKPSKRSEGKEDCVGTCLENKALKVSSTLELPDEVKNPIKVKMMVYVEQGGLIQKQISANEYIIEGCLPPTKGGIIVAFCLAVILITVDIIYMCLLKRHQNEQGKDEEAPVSPASSTNVHTDRLQAAESIRSVPRREREKHTEENKNAEKEKPDARSTNVDTGRPEVIETTHKVHVHVQETEEQRHENNHAKKIKADDIIVPIIVSGVISICCIILLVLKHETRIPDLNGNCQDFYNTNMTSAVAVTFVIILICNHWKVSWEIVTLIRGMSRKMKLRKSMMLRKSIEGNADEAKELLGINRNRPHSGHSTNIDTCGQEVAAEQIHKKETHERKEQDIKSKEKTPEDSYRQETKHCDLTLPCFPSRNNKVLTNVGQRGKLTCIFDSKDYPSWQAPGGKIINYGGDKNFQKEFKRISWDEDKKSIIVANVQVSDAGSYLCFSVNGKVQTLDLVVTLPTESIEVSANKTAHLDASKDLTRCWPVWRRPTPFVAELYHTVRGDRIELANDGKSIYIKDCIEEDKGLYEVMGNNVIKRFDVSITNNKQCEKTYPVDEGSSIRLDCSSKEDYPSWECEGADIFNYGGEEAFRSIRSGFITKKPSRFCWSVDKKSLMIGGILPNDTGTYICRHANGYVESVTVIVRGKPQLTSFKRTKNPFGPLKRPIPHNTGYKFPSLKYVTNTGEADGEIAHQNFETEAFQPAKKEALNTGYILKNKRKQAVECSVYGKSIQVFEINERHNDTSSDNRASVSAMSDCSEGHSHI